MYSVGQCLSKVSRNVFSPPHLTAEKLVPSTYTSRSTRILQALSSVIEKLHVSSCDMLDYESE